MDCIDNQYTIISKALVILPFGQWIHRLDKQKQKMNWIYIKSIFTQNKAIPRTVNVPPLEVDVASRDC